MRSVSAGLVRKINRLELMANLGYGLGDCFVVLKKKLNSSQSVILCGIQAYVLKRFK